MIFGTNLSNGNFFCHVQTLYKKKIYDHRKFIMKYLFDCFVCIRVIWCGKVMAAFGFFYEIVHE